MRLKYFYIAQQVANIKMKMAYAAATPPVKRMISGSSIGGVVPAAPGTGTPWARSQAARVATAAPKSRFMPTVTVRRFSGFSRKLPFTHWLKAPMAGPHQIW